jgi:integrase
VAMIGNGAPMPVISAVLGHASTDTTQAYYLSVIPEVAQAAAEAVAAIVPRTAGARWSPP